MITERAGARRAPGELTRGPYVAEPHGHGTRDSLRRTITATCHATCDREELLDVALFVRGSAVLVCLAVFEAYGFIA